MNALISPKLQQTLNTDVTVLAKQLRDSAWAKLAQATLHTGQVRKTIIDCAEELSKAADAVDRLLQGVSFE